VVTKSRVNALPSASFIVLASASSFAPLSIDLLAPVLPDIAEHFAVPLDVIQTSVFMFLLGYGIGPLFWGKAADRWGKGSIMLVGLILYIACSFAGGFCEDGRLYNILRFFQGIGASAGVIAARAILRDLFHQDQVTRAISTLFAWMVLVPILCPLVGSLLGHYFPWYYSMFLMGIIGTITLIGFITLFPGTASVQQVGAGTAKVTPVISNRLFLRYALANMFTVSVMVLFATNYSYLATFHFELSGEQLGGILSLFNASVAAGVYIARWLILRRSIESCVKIGAVCALLGWLCFSIALVLEVPGSILLLLVTIACAGKGIVLSLSAGEALKPFSSAAGTASAYYTLIQSVGSALLAYVVSSYLPKTIISVLLATCCFMLGALLLSSSDKPWRANKDLKV